ncbi:MAG: FecR family protein [Bacillota bacterium]
MLRAKRSALLLSAVSIAFSIGLGLHGDASAETGRPKAVAEISRLEGTVVVLRAGSKLWEGAAAGRSLYHGDRVKTESESWATLALASSGSLMLGPSCEVCFDSLLHLRLFIGRIWAKVRPVLGGAESFRVQTPAAVVGVRGTGFSVCVSADGATTVSVVSGLVEVAGADGMVLVPPGYATHVRRGRAPVLPRPMDDEEKRAWDEKKRRARDDDWNEDDDRHEESEEHSSKKDRGDHGAADHGPPDTNAPPGNGLPEEAGKGGDAGDGYRDDRGDDSANDQTDDHDNRGRTTE